MIQKPKFQSSDIPLSEYPRPQFQRESYFSLNGVWDYAISEKEEKPAEYQGKILVPYSPESVLSGVQRQLKKNEFLHYRRFFTLSQSFNQGRVFLNVGACDQVCKVYLNGQELGIHEGGYLPFSLELTEYLQENNELTFVVQDDASSEIYGRGKQSYNRGGIWYTAISGLWQSVWLESTPKEYVKNILIYPDCDKKQVEIKLNKTSTQNVIVRILDENSLIAEKEGSQADFLFDASACKEWSVESPQLYTIEIDFGEDKVKSYFGLRKYSIMTVKGKKVFALNNRPIFHNGLLDQGYYKDGIYTPKSNQDCYDEIATVKNLGFNMLRKHIKIEPALWYYYCDCLGMLVWQDMMNGGGKYSSLRIHVCPFIDLHIDDHNYKGMKRDNERSRNWFLNESTDTIESLFNCVSICLWTPFNEAWGQFDAVEVCNKLRLLDNTRFFDHASGWQDKGGGDVYSRHIYFRKVRLKNDKKRVLALTEFGGYSYGVPGHIFEEKSFGYKGFRDKQAYSLSFEKLYLKEIVPAIEKQLLCATVYTQLTDVEEEINGIFTFDRVLKLNEDRVRTVNKKIYQAFENAIK